VSRPGPRIVPFGDAALLVELGGGIDIGANRLAHAMAAAVRSDAAGPWGCPVPAYDSVLVPYDPLEVDVAAAADRLTGVLAGVGAPVEDADHEEGPFIKIPVRYGGADGPDLEEVAALHGSTPARVIAIHSGTVYRVFHLGFAPGFSYLASVPAEIVTPRRATPRTRVPAGSVGIAGLQTGVYPVVMPGGWNLIGRTEAVLWDARRDPPALLRPGAHVRFVPVGG